MCFTQKNKSVVLCVLDGWGHRPLDAQNPLRLAAHWQSFLQKYPYTLLNASEQFVGLPVHQMGNSEVGHMTIGLGRVMSQDLQRISKAIADNTFENESVFTHFINTLQAGTKRCHLMGLFSDGGVHSHEDHFMYVAKTLAKAGLQVVLHILLDGRDTAAKAALSSLNKLDTILNHPHISIGTIGGRYYTMDRDKRFERTMKGYRAFMASEDTKEVLCAKIYVQECYDNEITDEFIPCVKLKGYQGFNPNDGLFMINFRADRARQFLQVFISNLKEKIDFTLEDGSRLRDIPKLETGPIITMTPYGDQFSKDVSVVFAKIPVKNGLGQIVCEHGLKQLRIGETEKYAHVTYFFNGGIEVPFEGEDRILVASPKVATYDLQPEMSANEVTTHVVKAMQDKQHSLIVVNYANADMVGHTGVKEAVEKAIVTLDDILSTLHDTALKQGWTLIITADHGNAETGTDDHGNPHTAHTCNLVPFMVISDEESLRLREGVHTLADIAPTVLTLLNLPVPHEMTGEILLVS